MLGRKGRRVALSAAGSKLPGMEAEASGADVSAVRAQLAAEYTYNVASPFLAAERGELDGIIEPSATRISVIKALRALRTKRSSLPPKKHGNIPL